MSNTIVPKIGAMQITKAIALVLKTITDVDAVLFYEKDFASNIAGRFRSGKEIFDYLITPDNKVSFVASAVRSDAYLGGYYLPEAQPLNNNHNYFWGYVSSQVLRKDAKGKKCKVGQRCKNTCIAKGLTCANQSLAPRSAQTLAKVRMNIPSKPKININPALLVGAVAIAGAGALALSARSSGDQSPPQGAIVPATSRRISPAVLGGATAVAIAGGGAAIATRSQSKGVKEDIPASPVVPADDPWETPPLPTRSRKRGVEEDIPASPVVPADDPWETPPLPPEEDAPYTGPSITSPDFYINLTTKWRPKRRQRDLPTASTNAPQLPPARRKVGAKSVEVIRPVTSSEPPEEAISGTTRDRIRNRTDPVPPRNNLPLFPPIRGKSVRESVGVEGFDPDSTRKLESALDAVDKVLKVEGLHESTITPADTNGKYVAFYKPVWTRYAPPGQEVQYSDDKMGHIHIDPQVASRHGSFTSAALHEVAHAIDHQVLGKDVAGFGSEKSPDFDEFKAVYQQTKAYKRIQKMKNSPISEVKQRAEVADNPKEYFARAFEQYVARKSGSKSLQAQVKAHQNHRNSPYWDDSDFKQVEAALDKFFTQKGMR